MKKIFLFLVFLLVLSGCQQTPDRQLTVGVAIVPQARFIEKIAGDLVHVVVMIPPGNSPANYQLSPKEMVQLDDAQMYFGMGVPAEENLRTYIEDQGIQHIYLDEEVSEVYEDRYFEDEGHDENHEEDHDEGHEEDHDEDHDEDHEGHDHVGRDPHIWLSPKRVILMVEIMRDQLVVMDPENKDLYEKNAAAYLDELTKADQTIQEKLSTLTYDEFLIYHPAYGYFADDYDLHMVSIEVEGKEAHAQGIESIVDFALEKGITKVYYQEEFDQQQAEVIAKEIQGQVVKLAPLSKDYLRSLQDFVDSLVDGE